MLETKYFGKLTNEQTGEWMFVHELIKGSPLITSRYCFVGIITPPILHSHCTISTWRCKKKTWVDPVCPFPLTKPSVIVPCAYQCLISDVPSPPCRCWQVYGWHSSYDRLPAFPLDKVVLVVYYSMCLHGKSLSLFRSHCLQAGSVSYAAL